MAHSTAKLRQLWGSFECDEGGMVVVPFGPDRIRVAPPTADAWQALAAVFRHHRYAIRTADTDSYNCRNIKGTSEKSLHAFGIALDVNWHTNPFRDHPGKRAVRHSAKETQEERAEDVRLGAADTDMTAAMIADVLGVRTTGGKQVFEWGGSWTTVKDCMHFEIDLSPEELAAGIDTATVAGWDALLAVGDEGGPALARKAAGPNAAPEAASGERHTVIARDGLNLRAGPSTEFKVLRTCPARTELFVIGREGAWALVDLEGSGLADGYMSLGFLRPATAAVVLPAPVAVPVSRAALPADILDRVTPEIVKRLFPATSLASIAANLPSVGAGLRSHALGDRPMVLMALATIRAETEGFVPISEGRSRFNTRHAPFDLYDAGTPIGARLGNTETGDGARFKGRGYIQLTGRSNYSRIGGQIGVDLVGDPERANDPATAGVILARFLKNKEGAIRAALARDDLRSARKLVNGGSHGFERFEDAHRRGDKHLPS